MWHLYRQAHLTKNTTFSLLAFCRRIVIALLVAPPSSSSTGPKPKLPCNVLSEVRHDGKGHWIDRQETQRRCGKCGKCTNFFCLKCYFCKKFRVGERCCEFICLDPPGDTASKMLEEYRRKLQKSEGSTQVYIRLLYVLMFSVMYHSWRVSWYMF
nr:unnamed protein product [Callosobruchus chinensis]